MECVNNKIRLFADDIILYKQVSSVSDADRLQTDLESLQHWEEKWLLKFNISKCYVLKITRAKVHKIEYNYQLHNKSLAELNSCKYLGITIQSDQFEMVSTYPSDSSKSKLYFVTY